jgi:prepilin-type N-terminal cleavage/methylation domain-containing protein
LKQEACPFCEAEQVIINPKNRRPKSKGRNRKQGFTLIEVLVGIIVMATFTGTAMQAIVSATAFKVKAEELSEATVWIQEDLELVRYQASKVEEDVPACTASTLDKGYAQKLKNELPSADEVIKTSAVGARPYTVQRTAEPSTVQPFNVLKLNYVVKRQGESTLIAQLYSEVIPDKFLSCP